MTYWSVDCRYCGGYIADALLECVPAVQRTRPGYTELNLCQPGAALACPYCNQLIGFDAQGKPEVPTSGWPVFRYGKAELDLKKQSDGESPFTPLTDWALRRRFTKPGKALPFSNYTYAEQAPPDEVVP